MQVAGTAAYRDHYRYSQRDAEGLQRRAQAAGAEALICTEKDIYNFTDAQFHPLRVLYCRIALRLPEGEKFWDTVKETIERKRHGAVP